MPRERLCASGCTKRCPKPRTGTEKRHLGIETLFEYCQQNRRTELLEQWDREKNMPLTPETVTWGSNRKVWWRCEKGHPYWMGLHARTAREQGCPYCSGRKVLAGYNDLATVAPELAKEWHPTLNGDLTPQMVTAGSSKFAWWRCPLGHVWRTRIDTRAGAQHSGCPVCAGNVKRRHLDAPELRSN